MANPQLMGGGIAAIVVALAMVGIGLLYGSQLGDRTPSASPMPTATPISLLTLSGELDPGTYSTTFLPAPNDIPVRLTFTVPAGWSTTGGFIVKGGIGSSSETALLPWDFTDVQVYRDPCRVDRGFTDPPVGPTVGDLAAALAAFEERLVTPPVDVTLAGYPGVMLEFVVPDDVGIGDCAGGQYRTWRVGATADRFHQGPGQHDRLWILDVGGHRVGIDAAFLPGTPAEDVAELEAILESIRIE